MEGTDAPPIDTRLAAAGEAVRLAEQRSLVGQLALEMIHEIKNPLEALGHLTYLARAQAEDPERVREYMSMAEEQMATLRRVASQTLGFARTSEKPRMTQVIAIAEAALRIHQRAIESKKIRLVKDLCASARAEVFTGEMLQLISNLIANALDALPASGTLFIRIRRGTGMVHFVVADSGHGIPKEHLSKVFQPFFTTKEERGTGLGLALTRRIVERHRGTIRIRSSVRPGKSGTTFRISIPA